MVSPGGGEDLDFVFEFDEEADPTEDPTLSAAVTNLFYWHNIVHDIFYLNGFDEVSGNFQENNFELGGLGDDGVQANAQDGAGFNNANFATPADGSRPRCRMYLWNAWTPFRDGDFDSGIIIHEIGHGVSNRLTGGPTVTGCLPGGQSGGMGEGWSDWWAIALQQVSDISLALKWWLQVAELGMCMRCVIRSCGWLSRSHFTAPVAAFAGGVEPAEHGLPHGRLRRDWWHPHLPVFVRHGDQPGNIRLYLRSGILWRPRDGLRLVASCTCLCPHGLSTAGTDYYDGTGGNNALWRMSLTV